MRKSISGDLTVQYFEYESYDGYVEGENVVEWLEACLKARREQVDPYTSGYGRVRITVTTLD